MSQRAGERRSGVQQELRGETPGKA